MKECSAVELITRVDIKTLIRKSHLNVCSVSYILCIFSQIPNIPSKCRLIKHRNTLACKAVQRSNLVCFCVSERVCVCTWLKPLVLLTAGGCVCAAAAFSAPLYPECFCAGREPDSARHYIPTGTRDPSAA